MKHLLILSLCLLLAGTATAADSAANIMVPALKVKQGENIQIPIIIDRAEGLAGVKLVIHYDAEILAFRGGKTTRETQSLMSVINDKNPGRLIIVLAGAKGISGENVPLLILTFTAGKLIQGRESTRLDIREIQLMNDQLKEITGKPAVKALEILP